MSERPADVLDACVLPHAPYEPRWTGEILKEVTRTLIVRFNKTPDRPSYREVAMREFFPGALVEDYQRRIPEMKNHPKDRHVLAAAIACDADFVVTFNIKDSVAPFNESLKVRVVGPSTFLMQLAAVDRVTVEGRLREQAGSESAFLLTTFTTVLRIRFRASLSSSGTREISSTRRGQAWRPILPPWIGGFHPYPQSQQQDAEGSKSVHRRLQVIQPARHSPH